LLAIVCVSFFVAILRYNPMVNAGFRTETGPTAIASFGDSQWKKMTDQFEFWARVSKATEGI